MSVAMSVAQLSQLFASCVASSRLFHGIVGYAFNHGGDRRATLESRRGPPCHTFFDTLVPLKVLVEVVSFRE